MTTSAPAKKTAHAVKIPASASAAGASRRRERLRGAARADSDFKQTAHSNRDSCSLTHSRQ
jgi:hypothetical protein